MVSYTYMNHLKELIKENKVTEKTIDDAVRNILRIKFRMGLFDNPYINGKAPSLMYSTENLAAAKAAATQSAILLKNDNTLPINSSVKTIAVVGPMADAPYEQMGTWIAEPGMFEALVGASSTDIRSKVSFELK